MEEGRKQVNNSDAKKILFIFTKVFPFYNEERYIEDELKFLAVKFEKIIFVPCSIFGERPVQTRNIPANAEIFLINLAVKRIQLHEKFSHIFLYIVPVVCQELIHTREGKNLYSRFRTYLAILKQQISCAFAFKEYCRRMKIDPANSRVYSYWVHNGCIILGILKKIGFISDFVTRAHSYDLYHDDFLPEIPEKSPLAFQYFKIRSAKKIYAVSEHGKRYLSAYYKSEKDKFFVARLGVHTPTNPNPWSGNEFRIVTCSTIQELKRVYRIPEILSCLEFPVEWIHFGKGNDQDIEKLDTEIRKYSKPNVTIVLKGYTSNPDVLSFYKNTPIHLFLNLSLAEGVPVSLMEAASYGIPLLVTDVYGNKEIVCADGGVVIPKNFEAKQVAQIISYFRNNDELQQNYRRNIREHQIKYFKAESNYSNFTEEIQNA